jgi:hypothetical protein
VRFVVRVYDELQGTKSLVTTLRGDVATHAPHIAQAGLDRLVGQFDLQPCGPFVEPGDLLVCGPVCGGPGHVMIVGTVKNQLWHASYDRVKVVGMGITGMLGNVLHSVWRMPLRWWGAK